MIKKTTILSLIVIGIVIYDTPRECLAETTLAQTQQNIISLIEIGDFNNANSATSQFIAGFSGKPGFDETLQRIAEKYRGVKNYQKAIELSRYIITNKPASNRAVWSQMEIVMSNMLLGNDAAAQTETNVLTANYNNDPNLPRVLFVIGEQYRWTDKYSQAKDLYQRIIQEHPNDEYATKARMASINTDIIANINSGDFVSAKQSVDQIVTDFPSDPCLPYILFYTAQKFGWSRQYEHANSVYRQIVQRFPASEFAEGAQKGVAKTEQVINIMIQVDSGNYNQAVNAVDAFISNYGNEPEAPATIFHIASKLEEVGQVAVAGQVHEKIVQRYPNQAWYDVSRMGIQRNKILAFAESGDETSEKTAFDSMIDDFRGNSHLPTSLFLTAEGYYRKACKAQVSGDTTLAQKYFDKTLQSLDVVINRLPASEETLLALSLAGDCHYQVGDFQKSADTFQRIVDKYPDSKNTWNALFKVAEGYQRLQKLGVIPVSEANSKIQSAYRTLLQKYPNCPVVPVAQRWLDKNVSE